jgi:hypothetical protein
VQLAPRGVPNRKRVAVKIPPSSTHWKSGLPSSVQTASSSGTAKSPAESTRADDAVAAASRRLVGHELVRQLRRRFIQSSLKLGQSLLVDVQVVVADVRQRQINALFEARGAAAGLQDDLVVKAGVSPA